MSIYNNDYGIIIDFRFLENPRSSLTHNISYRPSYMRGAPYLLGLIEAILLEKIKEKNIKFSKVRTSAIKELYT